MSALPLEVLSHLETTADIRVVRDGDQLRVLTRPGADAAPVTERVRQLKPVLHEATLQREMVALACGPADRFDRTTFDALYAEWDWHYGVTTLTQTDSTCEGDQP